MASRPARPVTQKQSTWALATRRGGPIRRLAAVLAIVFGVASLVVHGAEFLGPDRYSKDFALDYTSAQALRHGASPYAPIKELIGTYLDAPPGVLEHHVLPGGNWHPPFKIVLTVPLTYIPFGAAAIVWMLISAACIIWALLLLGSELGWERTTSVVAGFAALALPVVELELSAGNVEGVLLLLLVATWRSLARGRDRAAGATLGLSVAFKVFPAFVALPLLGTRRRRPVLIGAAIAVVLTVIGLIGVGASSGGDHLHALRSDGYSYWLASPANISIWGLATRWLVPNGWVNGASLAVIGKVLAVFLALTIVALALRPPTGRTRDPFWAAVPLMLLAWPITWNQYLVLALPWVIIALTRAVEDRSRPMIVATVVVGALLMLGLPPGLTSIDRASDLQVALGYQVPTLALIGAMALEFVGGGARHFNNQRSGREP